MKKAILIWAVLFILISPIFGLRHFILKNRIEKQTKDLEQLVNEENIRTLKSLAAMDGYAAAISLTVGILLIIGLVWVEKEAPLKTSNTNSAV